MRHHTFISAEFSCLLIFICFMSHSFGTESTLRTAKTAPKNVVVFVVVRSLLRAPKCSTNLTLASEAFFGTFKNQPPA